LPSFTPLSSPQQLQTDLNVPEHPLRQLPVLHARGRTAPAAHIVLHTKNSSRASLKNGGSEDWALGLGFSKPTEALLAWVVLKGNIWF